MASRSRGSDFYAAARYVCVLLYLNRSIIIYVIKNREISLTPPTSSEKFTDFSKFLRIFLRGGVGIESPLSGKNRNFLKPAPPWGEEEERVLKLEAERAGAARAVLPCSEVHSARPGARCGAQTRMRGGATPS